MGSTSATPGCCAFVISHVPPAPRGLIVIWYYSIGFALAGDSTPNSNLLFEAWPRVGGD